MGFFVSNHADSAAYRAAANPSASTIQVQEKIISKLTLKQANTIIDNALAKAREMKIKPLAVVVLDDSGNVVASQREDNASMFRFDIALGKRAKDNQNFFLALAATAKGKFLAQPGAALIRDAQGNVLGAAGASGGTGDEDEAACAYGIEKAGLKADVAA